MKVTILGAGLMGKEVARDMVSSPKVEKIYLADVDVEKVRSFVERLNTDKIELLTVDATIDEQLRDAMSKADVVVNALFYSFNLKVAQMAIEIGVHSVDLGGHIGGITDEVLKLDAKAKEKGVTLIPDLGVAPGMTNILAGYGASKLDRVNSIKLYVGGIPVEKQPPLNYNVVFSLDGVFDHYTNPSVIIRDGTFRELPSLTEIENLYFPGFVGLEAFHTSGGLSTLPQSFPKVQSLEYKTIRYAGHAEHFKLLVDLGLTKKGSDVTLKDGTTVEMREVMKQFLQEKLNLGDKEDVVLLRVEVHGERNEERASYQYEMVTYRDKNSSETAMALATANTISVVAQLIGDGTITQKGVLPPEVAVPGEEYMSEMNNHGVTITETVLRSTNIIKG
ncbi:MAG: saccharopine dehydrogenase C-terminal domain-containing protein [Kurthia sp.]|uniref:Lysine 6-dehydrogenase n=1 Tax=Kurthia zopfii TaxID=1650 RepID=A0A8B4Q6I5_9BACL|nr:saccharopine dehydrogenase C-terminal domain-containing protein [Kurthia zopfii]PWI22409.1 saccharopine dehydrogenase [Kurthia zopfii]TDR38461.1 lysine 6-dehydrogenase [Kurthia zopfii]GEK30478.1 saccharopine dehydrogenase [Kurthia zopfii]STX08551.1 Saccharopine dehydrogenase [Kurthia zopfii]